MRIQLVDLQVSCEFQKACLVKACSARHEGNSVFWSRKRRNLNSASSAGTTDCETNLPAEKTEWVHIKQSDMFPSGNMHQTPWTCIISKFKALKTDMNHILLDLNSHWLHDAPIIWRLLCDWLTALHKLSLAVVGVEAHTCTDQLSIKRRSSQDRVFIPFNDGILCFWLDMWLKWIWWTFGDKISFCWCLLHHWNTCCS